ncbi:GAF domain-containing protein [Nocardia jejuensis]|uniref:GAF domain-containing protein n=1 Tax=Nocardia jejuensis TaxID=328049 RepID=UPI0008330721|nr:GAF domain-containing protein [Nocardia jejuensis]
MRPSNNTNTTSPVAGPAAKSLTPEPPTTAWQWIVIDTMDGPANASLILDGSNPRRFSRLARSSIARNGSAAHCIEPLVNEVTTDGATHDKYFHDRTDHVHHMIAVPVLGPFGAVHAVAMWVGKINEPLPRIPIIGAVEWDASGLVSASPAAQFLLRTRHGDALTGHTITEMLAALDHLEDRSGFLALFNMTNLATPTDQWSGIATTTDETGQKHDIFLAARPTVVNGERRVRAVVADITGTANPGRPDLTLAAIRHMPVPPGHVLALADLITGFIHEFMCAPNSPLVAWRHHNPIFTDDDHIEVANACFSLAAGVVDTVTSRVNVRFSPDGEPILLDARWTRVLDGERPQALIDITPISQIPSPVVPGCRACEEIAANQP